MFPAYIEMPFTYTICALVILMSIIGFYHKTFYQFFIYHPYEVFRGKRIHTIFTSAFVHKNWWHLIFNSYIFYGVNRDIEYIILEDKYSVLNIKLICLLVCCIGIVVSNIVIGWYYKNDMQRSFIGFSGAAFCAMGLSLLYLPLDHPKEHYSYIPLYFSYEFVFALLIVFGLLPIIFRKSATNHKGHLISLVAGFLIAIIIRPVIILEIINHLKNRFI